MERAKPSVPNTFAKLFGPCAFDLFSQAKDDVQCRAIAYIFQQNVIPTRLIHGQSLHDQNRHSAPAISRSRRPKIHHERHKRDDYRSSGKQVRSHR